VLVVRGVTGVGVVGTVRVAGLSVGDMSIVRLMAGVPIVRTMAPVLFVPHQSAPTVRGSVPVSSTDTARVSARSAASCHSE